MPACPRCGEPTDERARFCPACGASLPATEATRAGVRKTVTVVFSDVTDWTGMGERHDPEQLRGVMDRYFAGVRSILERHGGTVEKFIGDAVMAVFGTPVVHEDDALRALRAVVELRDALAELNEELERDFGMRIAVRTGVTSGEVIAGDARGAESFVTGEAVNVAQRLQQAAASGEILIGEVTYRLARDAVVVEALEPLAVKGKHEPVSAYRLLEVHPDAPGHAPRFESPIVGRSRERMLLADAFGRAVRESSCHLFTVLGPAGVGKSRLVAEVLAEIGDRATILQGSCLAYGEGITFWPVREIVLQATGLTGDDAEGVRSFIAARLEGDDDAAVVAELVSGLIGLGREVGATEESFWAVRHLLEVLARRRPVVVVLDDVNWGEPTFLDLVEHVADWARDAPILLVCLARPELLDLRPTWGGGKLNATSILLEPLTEAESERLIDNLLGRTALAEARARIQAAAEGNPLFVEEMLRMLVDDGLLRQDDGRWVSTGDLGSVEVPTTIRILLAARLDRLGDDERRVIERGSVEGKVFHRGAVEALSPDLERERVDACLLALMRKELVRPERSTVAGEDGFRFRHILIRDAAYDAVSKGLRADHHERFAEWVADRPGEHDEFIGYHLEQAVRYRRDLGPTGEHELLLARRAADHLASAGRKALARGDGPAAANLLDRAVSLLDSEPAQRDGLLVDLGVALIMAGELARAEDRARGGRPARDHHGRRVRSGRTRCSSARSSRATCTPSEAATTCSPPRSGRSRSSSGSATTSASRAHGGSARRCYWTRCQIGLMEEALQRALVHAERAGPGAAGDAPHPRRPRAGGADRAPARRGGDSAVRGDRSPGRGPSATWRASWRSTKHISRRCAAASTRRAPSTRAARGSSRSCGPSSPLQRARHGWARWRCSPASAATPSAFGGSPSTR